MKLLSQLVPETKIQSDRQIAVAGSAVSSQHKPSQLSSSCQFVPPRR